MPTKTIAAVIKHSISTQSLLLLAFFEGSAVMAAELASAKILAPVFGTSLYVWAAVLGVTLLSLTSGYFAGGRVSRRDDKSILFWTLALAGAFLILMPFAGDMILKNTINFEVRTGATLSLLIFLLPPLFLMGMSSPQIISMLPESHDQPGDSSGKVYAISTLGGIVSTFLTGFYLLPEFGIVTSTFVTGLPLTLIAIYYLLKNRKTSALLLLAIPLFFLISRSKEAATTNASIREVYHSEGILGQVRVIDQYHYLPHRGWVPGRGLLVNNTSQTVMDLTDPSYDLWPYSFLFAHTASIYPKGSDALIIGMGGGTLLKQFNRLGFNVEAVEIDKRIRQIGYDLFNVSKSAVIHIDDGRHFINTVKKQFDVIAFDVFLSETPPAHLFTIESFQKVKDVLKKDGMLIINFYGFLSGDAGKPSRSVLKTLKEAGFKTQLIGTPGDEEAHRNIFFLASLNDLDLSKATYREPNSPEVDLKKLLIPESTIDLSDAEVLTDRKNPLEHQYIKAAIEWRQQMNKSFASLWIKEGIPVFK